MALDLSAPATNQPARTTHRRAPLGPAFWAFIAAGVCLAPTLAVVFGALSGLGRPIDAGSVRLLAESTQGLAFLLLVGGGAATLLGVAAAWLVAMCAFPGRGAFEGLLVLPMAAPVYVLAYAYGGLTGPMGPIPVGLTGTTGAAFVYAVGLFPYVYLATRAAFMSQSVCALEAARSLGAGPLTALTRVALPLARPGIAAGAALALMEIAADYGAASYFGAQTLTTGVFHAWFARGEPQVALQLASLLLIGAVAFLALERAGRGASGYGGGSARWRPLPRYPLGAWGWAASGFCLALLTLGAILPLGWLARLALLEGGAWADLAEPLANTLILAFVGANLTLLAAIPLARAARMARGPARLASLLAGAGYAAPGAVMALGALSVFGLLREAGLVAGLTGAAAIACLLWTYAARFAAAGAQPLEAGLARLTPSLLGAAETLGASGWRRFRQVELPIAAPAALAANLILFVEILRELPATLLLRPFDFDTLAIRAHAYASDDRLAQAAAPALLIVAAGLIPILLMSRRMGRSRAGMG